MLVDNVRTTYYFGILELRVETTLQIRFTFALHCDVFFITSQLHYFFVRSKVFNDVRIKLYFSGFNLWTEITL